MSADSFLVLNSGSSSLKFGVFLPAGSDVHEICRGAAEGIAGANSKFWMRFPDSAQPDESSLEMQDQAQALGLVVDRLRASSLPIPTAIGHRVVHGGPLLREHQQIIPQVMERLEAAVEFAPLHLPVTLTLIRETQRLFPNASQYACFDTAFHRNLPEAAARFALPARYWEQGIRRYGFHGISCEFVLHALGAKPPGRIIVAHLGNGASITAIGNGNSVDTSMGLTPTGGIIMSTRSGDLDPGVILHLLRGRDMTVDELEAILDRESGLLGISGISGDVRALHTAAEKPSAQLALEVFCRSAKKTIAGYIAILGGLDLLVFTGGIGEHDAAVRVGICSRLEPFGVVLDPAANSANQPLISAANSATRVAIIATDEEMQIARHILTLRS